LARDKPNKKQIKRFDKSKDILKASKSETVFKTEYISYFILFAIFLFSFYIRGITPINTVFNRGVVGFAMDDSVFQMRLVENTIHFFPHRIFFDAFTRYPYGSQLSWGPLFDQMIAFFSIIIGFAANGISPAQITIDTTGAFFPAILGALIVFPVYFIGKELAGNKAGLLGAFLIAILPGQFLSRSVLGFTDHHVAEAFYTTLMMAFFIIAIKKAENITLDHWLNKDWPALKKPLIYSLMAGITLGAYLLTWTTGVFFVVVFGIFMVVQYVIDHFKGKSTEYLGVVGIIAYLTAMIMVLPYVDLNNNLSAYYYSPLHLIVTGGGAVVFAILSLISIEMNKRKYAGFQFILFLSAIILIGLITLKILIPDLYDATVGNWNYLFGGLSGGGLTVAEASPISYEAALGDFGYNYILSYIAILLLCYYAIKKSNAEYTLMVVWSVFVLGIMLAQNRFAYYYAVNVAILSGVLVSRFLDFSDWKLFNSDNAIECLKRIKVQHILSLILVIAVIGFLPFDASPYKMTMDDAKWGAVSSGFYEWHDALTWMKDNTPKPDLPYYSIYEKPPTGQKYNYSKNDYGVMSWWDYGHIITYWGHRIPNANPFQAGIGGGADHAPGASTFLVAQTEDEANKVLDDLGINGKPGARYVVSNAYMAYSIQPTIAEWDNTNTGYYEQVRTSQGNDYWPSMKYYNTMESKLHIFDTNGLHNYRLVHESTPNPATSGGNEEKAYKSIYNILNKDNPLPVEESGYAKIFEYVLGARITGSAPPGTNVTLANTIKTNIGRTIPYKQVTSSNGTYVFIVPYSTLGPIQGETRFDTGPVGPYSVTAGNVSKQVDVGEKIVLEGGTITIDLV
jgi:dolichyl-diphosphooligosaccharide--protein glycosyltransferase